MRIIGKIVMIILHLLFNISLVVVPFIVISLFVIYPKQCFFALFIVFIVMPFVAESVSEGLDHYDKITKRK